MAVAVASLVDSTSDEPFLDETQNIASKFLHVYLEKDEKVVAMSPQPPTVKEPAPKDDVAMQVAHRLKKIGDEIDAEVTKQLSEATQELFSHQTVFEIGYRQFSSVCTRVLTTCSSSLRTGWDQVGVIFMSMGNLVRELRQQNPQDQDQREGQFQRFAGRYMQDVHLDQWVETQGGMQNMGTAVQDPAHLMVQVD